MARIVEHLRDYINYAVGLTFTVVAFLLSREKLYTLLSGSSTRGVLSGTLLTLTIFWFFLYLRAVRAELDLLDSAFNTDELKRLSGMVLLPTLGLAVVFACLIAFSTDILYYSGCVLLFSVFDLYGQSVTNRNLGRLILQRRFRGEEGGREASVLFEYYFVRPLFLRGTMQLTAFCSAFCLSFYAQEKQVLAAEYVAYGLVIATVILGELVIHFWRYRRDQALEAVEQSHGATQTGKRPNPPGSKRRHS